jgi:hypothetical protein
MTIDIPDAAIDAFVDDFAAVVQLVLRNDDMDFFAVDRDGNSTSPTITALVESVERGELPSIDVFNQLCGWTIFMTEYNRKRRPLRPDELAALDAAWRLSDAIHGCRVRYRPRCVRTDD